MDNFYRAFEDRHRGPRTDIKARLKVYLPFVEPLRKHYPVATALDLGCGRGEWLELLTENGFAAEGVDLDEGMLQACREIGLNARQGDAIQALRAAPDGSLAIVSAFHVVEHIQFGEVQALVSEAARALAPGGILIMETPNPENLVVAGTNFYMDPSHQRPMPPELLSFVSEYAGFARVKKVRLQEAHFLQAEDVQLQLINVLNGASPDYAIVAQKAGHEAILLETEPAFFRAYGLTLDQLAERYDRQMVRRDEERAEEVRRIANKMRSTDEKLARMADELARHEAEFTNLATQLHAVYASSSWRLTAPLRWMVNQYRSLREQGIRQRARRAAFRIGRPIAKRGVSFLEKRPAWRYRCITLAERLGMLELARKVYRHVQFGGMQSPDPFAELGASGMTARAQRFYLRLKSKQSRDPSDI